MGNCKSSSAVTERAQEKGVLATLDLGATLEADGVCVPDGMSEPKLTVVAEDSEPPKSQIEEEDIYMTMGREVSGEAEMVAAKPLSRVNLQIEPADGSGPLALASLSDKELAALFDKVGAARSFRRARACAPLALPLAPAFASVLVVASRFASGLSSDPRRDTPPAGPGRAIAAARVAAAAGVEPRGGRTVVAARQRGLWPGARGRL